MAFSRELKNPDKRVHVGLFAIFLNLLGWSFNFRSTPSPVSGRNASPSQGYQFIHLGGERRKGAFAKES